MDVIRKIDVRRRLEVMTKTEVEELRLTLNHAGAHAGLRPVCSICTVHTMVVVIFTSVFFQQYDIVCIYIDFILDLVQPVRHIITGEAYT